MIWKNVIARSEVTKQSRWHLFVTSLAVMSALLVSPAFSEVQFISGSTGADGAFAPTADTVLTVPASGIFNFTSVNIPTGVTVTFAPDTTNSPVVILSTEDVVINGTLDISGQNGQDGSTTATVNLGGRRGHGGYDGGGGGTAGAVNVSPSPGGQGLGPTGGFFGLATGGGGGGSFPTTVITLVPVLGGSGGGGGGGGAFQSASLPGTTGGAGGGGGGALLIASSGNIILNGSIKANGGAGGKNAWPGGGCSGASGPGGGGSGGGIRLVTNSFQGTGTMSAAGGAGGVSLGCASASRGGPGRIRIEAFTFPFTGAITPGPSFAAPTVVLPPGVPTLTITSVGGVPVPSTPAGSFFSVDLALPSGTTNPFPVTVATTGITSGTVRLKVIPQFDGPVTNLDTTVISLNETLGFTVTFTTGASVLIAFTPSPITIASALSDILPLAEGEKLEFGKVETTAGGGTKIVFLTKSGTEVPAEQLFGHVVTLPEKAK